jgi:hypothetical protein
VANFRNTAWEYVIYRNQDIELVRVDDNFNFAGYQAYINAYREKNQAYINSIAPPPAGGLARNIPIEALTINWVWK